MRYRDAAGRLVFSVLLAGALTQGCAQIEREPAVGVPQKFRSLVCDGGETGNLLAMSSLERPYSEKPHLAAPWHAAIFGRPTQRVPIVLDEEVAEFGARSGRVETDEDRLVHIRHQRFYVCPGEEYTFSVYLRGQGVDDAHLRIATFSSEPGGGSRAEWATIESRRVDKEELDNSVAFVRLSCTIKIPEDCHSIEPAITFHGPGTLWFDGAQLERSPVATPFHEGLRDRNLERLVRDHTPRSWHPNSGVTALWPPLHAFDGRPDTYWASNDPDHSLPKDIGVSFPEPTTVHGAKVVYFNDQQRPTLVGGRWQTREGGEWVDIVSRIVDAGPVMVYDFREPVTTTTLRLFVDDMRPAPEPYNKRPAIREILFDFGP